MSIPSKGSRSVRVGDAEYRWRIRKQPTYAQAVGETSMTVAIQSTAPGARSVLVVDLRVARPDNWLAPHQTAVTPALVRDLIARARAAGWEPASTRSFAFEHALSRDAR